MFHIYMWYISQEVPYENRTYICSFDALTELGAFMRTECVCFSVLRVASGPRVKLAGRKSALTSPPPHPRWFILLIVLRRWSRCYLLFVALWFILRDDLFYVLPCVNLFLCPFSIAITSLGEERASLGAYRTFVQCAPVWFCLFPLPLGVRKGLRFVIVALPGLFSYPFFGTVSESRTRLRASKTS